MRTKRFIRKLFTLYIPLVFFLSFTLFPIYWLIISSLKKGTEIFSFPPTYFPKILTFENYREILQSRMMGFYKNSIITSGLTCLILMVLIVLSGYAMARFRFKG